MVDINIKRIRKEAEEIRSKSIKMKSSVSEETHLEAWKDMELFASNVIAVIMDEEFSIEKFTPAFMQYSSLKSRLSIN